MLLTIATTHRPATDLGFLLHKRPDRFQSFELSFGKAHVFYPEACEDRCTACLMLDVDPVGMVRGRGREQKPGLGQYVNDRPYVGSSFLSVAISQVFGTALAGRCKDRPELVETPIPLTVKIDVLPVRAGPERPRTDSDGEEKERQENQEQEEQKPAEQPWMLHRIFEPLGYEVEVVRYPLDEKFPEWGKSPYCSVALRATKPLSEVLTHLFVLVPVFDNQKHYFVGDEEIEKLLAKGAGWLASHPEKELITRRYLRHRHSLFRQALSRLVDEEEDSEEEGDGRGGDRMEQSLERPLSLHEQRHGAVLAALRGSGARSVLDLGCGGGQLLRSLLRDRQFDRIVGLDVSIRSLERAKRRLRLDRLPERQAARIKLIHGSLTYRDDRLEGFDAATLVEVIEHLDPPRLSALEKVLFASARPGTVVLTTPNRDYNSVWETLPAGEFRHSDHRFEWSREEFEGWAARVAGEHGYAVRFLPVGPEVEGLGAPTQMAVFERGKRAVAEAETNPDTRE